MSDIFREVEEDVRRERLQKLWKQYGDYVIAAVMALVIGVAGFKIWQHYEYVQTQKASAAYLKTLEELGTAGKPEEAARAYAAIAKKAPGGYAKVARLAEANALLEAGKKTEAVALYKKLADDGDEVGDIARIRAGWALAETAPKTDLQALLKPLNDGKSGWHYMAEEILAYADFRDGRLQAAEAAYKRLGAEKDAPGSIRQRALAMDELLRNGVGDYGTLPPPKAADAGQSPESEKGTSP